MPGELARRVEAATGARVAETVELDGGAVGTVHRVTLADGRTLAAKTGDGPLETEAAMLRYLDARTDLPVPAVEHAAPDLLVLEYVDGGDPLTPDAERDLADRVAALHEVTADACGFHYDTPSGALRQPNPRTDSWVEFVREFRLRYVADRALDAGKLPPATRERVDALCADLDALVAEPDAPALVHGDLWRGNLLVDGDRVAAVLDPALSYGHPELDLAYARWTGTVGDPFFERYRQRRGPGTPGEGWHDSDPVRERFAVYEVHALLEHVWHFGEEYRPRLRTKLSDLGY